MPGIKRNMFPPPDLLLKNGEKHLLAMQVNKWKMKS